jgi:MYXO-CTERM domain-containing protein
MRAVRVLGAFVAVTSFLACNAQPGVEYDLGTGEQALTGGCSINQLGAPCDPDGTGPLQECQGVCTLQPGTTIPSVRCLTLAAAGVTSNDGKICGAGGGAVGNCNQVCQGTLCVAKPAPNGAACRPGTNFSDTLCDGQCQLAPGGTTSSCVRITSGGCTIERPAAGGFNRDCVWSFCSAAAAKTCVSYPIPSGTACDDANACTTGDRCDGSGKCVATTTKTCPSSGTPCLDNKCNPSTGACVASPTTAACTFDACFAGTCSGGTCNKGAAIDCNDGNACTVDSCDSTTGCTHTAKACPAPDACTVSTCNPSSGACQNTPRSCDDGNPCTADSCDPTAGCAHTPIPGCLFDAGVDTGPPPFDTGAPPPLDTGVPPSDTSIEFDTGTIEEDTGVVAEDTGVAVIDGGEAGINFDEDLSRGGCGCRTTGSSTSTAGLAAAGLMAAAIVARRRRR